MIEQTLTGKFLEMANTQQKRQNELLAKQNVVGVALGNKIVGDEDTKEPALHVLVNQKLARNLLSKDDLVPKKLDDLKTDVVEVGEIFAGMGQLAPDIETMVQNGNGYGASDIAYAPDGRSDAARAEEETAARVRLRERAPAAAPQTLRQRARPAMGGFSVGHYNVTAGTIATCCYDLTPFPGIPEHYYILSNNHVLANSNNAQVGDPILQPGRYDGGQYPRDMIGRLSRFVPIRFHTATTKPCNYVDAAIAEVPFHLANRQIYWIGHIKDLYAAPQVGDILQKTGRTSNFSTGRVQAINATVDVNYGNGRVARFCNQIITTRMGAPGDSGSMVTNRDEHAVGLLFAGSPTVTILNNMLYVQALLRVRVHEQ